MESILDAFPYPWHRSEASDLHRLLMDLHPASRAAVLLAEQAGLDRSMINPDQAPFFLWFDILNLAGQSGMARRLVQTVHDRLDPRNPRLVLLAKLLANQPLPREAEPRRQDGAPNFITGDDDIATPEANLFHDDLTILIGQVPALIQTLTRLTVLAPAVCRMVVSVSNEFQYGTGFRIGPDLLLTNWHVLHNRDTGVPATGVTAEFGYEDDGRGGIRVATSILCDVATMVSDQADDWAIIRAGQPMNDAWPIIRLSAAVPPVKEEVAFIIQHPAGQHKRIGYTRNNVSFVDQRVVHYLTDTQDGSSGAPVFNAAGQLIALHHAGGRPQTVAGKAPVKKNEGIVIARILQGLAAKNVAVP